MGRDTIIWMLESYFWYREFVWPWKGDLRRLFMCFWVTDAISIWGKWAEVRRFQAQVSHAFCLLPTQEPFDFPLAASASRHQWFLSSLRPFPFPFPKSLPTRTKNIFSSNYIVSKAGIKLEDGSIERTSGSEKGTILIIFKRYRSQQEAREGSKGAEDECDFKWDWNKEGWN